MDYAVFEKGGGGSVVVGCNRACFDGPLPLVKVWSDVPGDGNLDDIVATRKPVNVRTPSDALELFRD
ncbi:hypothetical protein HYU11_05290 [Candidatus Woesearchaeota archaeon]|nr:hypothetical protein [Candidatus Woesearchaeota archaeon]